MNEIEQLKAEIEKLRSGFEEALQRIEGLENDVDALSEKLAGVQAPPTRPGGRTTRNNDDGLIG